MLVGDTDARDGTKNQDGQFDCNQKVAQLPRGTMLWICQCPFTSQQHLFFRGGVRRSDGPSVILISYMFICIEYQFTKQDMKQT